MSHPVKDFYENVQCHLEKFIDDEEAATMVEYVMLALGAAMILVAALPILSNAVTANMDTISTNATKPLH